MKHTNTIAIDVLRDEYSDYPRNDWHYDREYKMIVKALEMTNNKCVNFFTDADTTSATVCRFCGKERHEH